MLGIRYDSLFWSWLCRKTSVEWSDGHDLLIARDQFLAIKHSIIWKAASLIKTGNWISTLIHFTWFPLDFINWIKSVETFERNRKNSLISERVSFFMVFQSNGGFSIDLHIKALGLTSKRSFWLALKMKSLNRNFHRKSSRNNAYLINLIRIK